MSCLRTSPRLTRYEGKLLGFGRPKTKNCIRDLFSYTYLLCIHPEAVKLLLKELQEGIYRSHTGDKSLSHRALTQGY